MAGEGPPSTTCLLALSKSWMPTSVGMTVWSRRPRVEGSGGWYEVVLVDRSIMLKGLHMHGEGVGPNNVGPGNLMRVARVVDGKDGLRWTRH